MLQPSHHGGHQLLQLLGPQPACLQDLLVVGLLLAVVVHHRPVADQRQGEATHPGVAGDDDLVDGAHPCSGDREEVSYTAHMHGTQMLGRYTVEPEMIHTPGKFGLKVTLIQPTSFF